MDCIKSHKKKIFSNGGKSSKRVTITRDRYIKNELKWKKDVYSEESSSVIRNQWFT